MGIVTIIDHRNFGNRLQNYALQEAIRALGRDTVTIRNTPRPGDGASTIQRKIETLRNRGVYAFVDRVRRMGSRPSPPKPEGAPSLARVHGNREFTLSLINDSAQRYEELTDTVEFARRFESFVVGSDQVWNPEFRLLNHIDFLTFAQERQRIAYAASMGVSELSPQAKRRYASYLRGIPAISVRELEASKIVYDLTGRRVPVVLDPTMLVRSEEWRNLASTPRSLDVAGYIAKFYLGEEDEPRRLLIEQYARKRGLRVININDPELHQHYCTSPTDFLGIIDNAHLVVTDSFHAAVFATMFQTPYVIRGRGQMNSRFATLKRKTGMQTRDWQTPAALEASIDIDWGTVAARIQQERADSLGFLEDSLAHAANRG